MNLLTDRIDLKKKSRAILIGKNFVKESSEFVVGFGEQPPQRLSTYLIQRTIIPSSVGERIK